jgi:hypothetical protein
MLISLDQREARHHYLHVKRTLNVRMKGFGTSDQGITTF